MELKVFNVALCLKAYIQVFQKFEFIFKGDVGYFPFRHIPDSSTCQKKKKQMNASAKTKSFQVNPFQAV